MIEYFEKKRSMDDALSDRLQPVSDDEFVACILQGLDASYGPFKAAVNMRLDLIKSSDILGYLMREEERLLDETRQMSSAPNLRPTTHIIGALTNALNLSAMAPVLSRTGPTLHAHLLIGMTQAPAIRAPVDAPIFLARSVSIQVMLPRIASVVLMCKLFHLAIHRNACRERVLQTRLPTWHLPQASLIPLGTSTPEQPTTSLVISTRCPWIRIWWW